MTQLRTDSLSFAEAVGQSVANVSPTMTPAIAVAVVVANAGTASWLVYIVATVAMVVVGCNIGTLARRISAAGSFFLYISRGLGPGAGMLAGWAMLAAYGFTAMALTAATALFGQALITALDLPIIVPRPILFVAISALVWLFATRDIRLSSRLALVLEAISVSMIAAVCFLSWRSHGFALDAKQNHLSGAHFGSVAQSVVFAIFSYVGFESAATLGAETRNPKKVIPRAVILTPILASLVFIVATYLMVQGFDDDTQRFGASSSPLSDIVTGRGAILPVIVYIGAAISAFACTLASINSFARILFSLGRYGFVHASMGVVHHRHRTPYLAVTSGVVLSVVVCLGFSRSTTLDMFGWFGTIASFGFIVVYLLCSLAAPMLLRRTNEARGTDIALGALGCMLMVSSLIGSLYPVPAGAYAYLPYGFVAYMLAGAAWFTMLKSRAPNVLLGIEHDLEGMVTGQNS